MATAAARSFRSEIPVRRPVASEHGTDGQPIQIVRQAFGSDVVGSDLSPRAQLGYRVLVDHVNRGRDPKRPYDGQVFLTDETFRVELGGVSKRQVQRIRSELLTSGWICLPKGDAGGRGNATIWYHLHADGRPCAAVAETLLKQRAAAGKANLRRAAARQLDAAEKDATGVILSAAEVAEKDDTDVALSRQRMTEPTTKDDRKDAKDDKTGVAYKEELFQELIPELKSTTTAANISEEFPPDFAHAMDQEVSLDDGALRRLWRGARAIVPDASAEEIRYFFHQRAIVVYRNRKLDNPTGLMLSTIGDWFPKRRVMNCRENLRNAMEENAALQLQVLDG